MSSETELTAEQRFREAFERLKANKPLVLTVGTLVSQNKVAEEAGCDPTALKKSRYPSLILEIQEYVRLNNRARPSIRQEKRKQRAARSDFNARLQEVSMQRDKAQSQLLSAQRAVLELLEENRGLKRRLEEVCPTPIPFGQ